MNLFNHRDQRRAAAGELSVTFRLWKRPHVTAGKTYATGFGGAYHIEDVRLVTADEITSEDLRLACLPDVEAVMALAGEHTGAVVTRQTPLYRVQLRFETGEPPAKPPLDLQTIAARLDRMDRTSARGPWTQATLRLIEENPRVVARVLARELDWELYDFKAHVRRLKALGLTLSHPVGYELTDLGLAYLDSLDE